MRERELGKRRSIGIADDAGIQVEGEGGALLTPSPDAATIEGSRGKGHLNARLFILGCKVQRDGSRRLIDRAALNQ
jgi:hypothetical protein